MRCIYCNTPLAAIDYCTGCGADITLLKRIGRISNLLYNRGLEKASVRDLSGAITCLKQSLKFNKENIDARNLLGLCYYETGEVVSALCEWVISKNMKTEENLADYYITELQNNKNRLDTINQTIRKYNQSIEYCRQDNEDMAIIQLKKVISQNPKLVKAYQLLSLLYLKHQEYEKARRLLRKAAAVDNTNTTTLRYLTEIEEATGKSTTLTTRHKRQKPEQEEGSGGTLRYVSGNETIIQPTTFRDSSTVATFINIALGILLGGAIVWFLVVPASRQSVQESANQQVTDANMKLATGTAALQDLEEEIDSYVAKTDTAEKERDDALSKAAGYEELLGVADLYVMDSQTSAADALAKLNAEDFDGNAKILYDDLLKAVSSSMFSQYYSAGTTAYSGGDYTTAAQQLKLAVESDPEGTNTHYYDALYYLGFAYYNLGDNANANTYFNEIVTKYPNQASQVQQYITNTSGTGNTDTGTSQGEASTQNGGAAGSGEGGTTGQDIDVYPGDANSGNTDNTGGAAYDPADVAWTDPNTGLNYDVYGNLLG
ncbi:MAG: tetratricopeptide repeat protein [Lachnospiraceae bacterium]|nr:tetratricopeptide repeat protein [Lachnospiraceae bacterium]